MLALTRILAYLPSQDRLRMRLMCREFREASIPLFTTLRFNQNTRIPLSTRVFIRQLEALTAVTQVVIVDRCEPCYNILKADRAVSKLSSLTLELPGKRNFPKMAVESIARRLTRATQLTKLVFEVPPIGKQVNSLCSIIHSCQALRELHWFGGWGRSLAAALRGVTSLHTLLVHPPLTQESLMNVSQVTHLKRLIGVRLSSDDDANALSAMTQLTYLDVRGQWVDFPVQISKLCSMQILHFHSPVTLNPSTAQRALSSMTLLRILSLFPFCSRDLAGWDSLVASLPSLTTLALCCRPAHIGQDGAYTFPQIVDPNGFGHLRELRLIVKGARFVDLYEFLSRLVQLRKLNLVCDDTVEHELRHARIPFYTHLPHLSAEDVNYEHA
jgi:hypothetical protein